jgi:pimeloyl-ACP methyl ester carboxylesterase
MGAMNIDGVEVQVEGAGPSTVVMVHGWPDTHRLWDTTVEALKPRWRCVRFTLPGFDLSRPGRAHSLDEVIETLHRIVTQTCPGQRVTLLVHDWGCVYGYQFAIRHPSLVARVIGVDIGDAGSREHQAELGLKSKAMVLGYQLWLAAAWRLGGAVGDRMARWMAGALRCPTAAGSIGAQMGYPYAVQWLRVKGGFGHLRAFDPAVPMLYLYGRRKPFMFHSQAWLDKLQARTGNRVLGLPTGHWVMVQQARAFNDAVCAWLAQTEPSLAAASIHRTAPEPDRLEAGPQP